MTASNFDPSSLAHVTTLDEIQTLPELTEGIFVFGLTDEKLQAISGRLPQLRHLIADGNTRVTDAGLQSLRRFSRLENLDLEWSQITDAGLSMVAALKSLRWVDLGFCTCITPEGASGLKRTRPDLEVICAWV
jgi:hypothetical protein